MNRIASSQFFIVLLASCIIGCKVDIETEVEVRDDRVECPAGDSAVSAECLEGENVVDTVTEQKGDEGSPVGDDDAGDQDSDGGNDDVAENSDGGDDNGSGDSGDSDDGGGEDSGGGEDGGADDSDDGESDGSPPPPSETDVTALTDFPKNGNALRLLIFDQNTTDFTATGNPTNIGVPAYVTGARGDSTTSMKFDGGTNYFYFDTSQTDLMMNTSQFGLSVWFKTNSAARQAIWHEKYTIQVRDYKRIVIENGQVTAAYSTDLLGGPSEVVLTTSGDRLDDNEWHHLVFVRDGHRTGKLYIDGVLIMEDTDNSGSGSGINPIDSHYYVGVEEIDNLGGVANFFDGELDNLYLIRDAFFDLSDVTALGNL